jgi:hypothetical protein
MVGKVLMPLLILPLLLLVIAGGGAYHWYSDTQKQFEIRQKKYKRLQDAEITLKTLRAIEPTLREMQQIYAKADTITTMDECRRYMSTVAKPDKGIRIDSTQAGTASSASQIGKSSYGRFVAKISCRSQPLSDLITDLMNQYPNLILTEWALEVNNQSQTQGPQSQPNQANMNPLLQFTATLVFQKIKDK